MAISIIASIFIFIDSNSIPAWEEQTDIGPVAMRIQGENLDIALPEIRNVSYVTKASLIETAPAFLRMDQNDIYVGSPDDPLEPVFLVQGNAYYLSDDFISDFPTEFEIIEGRYPANSSEIAIAYTDAQYWGIPIGRMMNYTHTLNGVKRTVFVVGIFKLNYDDVFRYVITDAVAIVTSEVLNPTDTQPLVYVDVDRDMISPIDPRGSLDRLNEIERNIASINPTGTPYFRYFIDNYLAIGIQSYQDALNLQKSRQVSRSQLLILLSGLLGFLAVRFNVSFRGEEMNFQTMRGASRIRILQPIMRELWILSIFSSGLSIILGLLLSRVAFCSTNYLEFNWQKFANSPILLTLDTVIILGVAGFILPIIGYLAQRSIKPATKKEVEFGRLRRIVNSIRLIHWDVFTFVLVGVLIFVLYVGGEMINTNPILLLIANYVQIPLFLAVASIFNKGIMPLARQLARIFRVFTGKLPAYIGMRGVVKNNSLSFLIILVLALILSSCLLNDVAATSLPNTHLAQTRYLIGGDLSFRLDNDESAKWDNFSDAVMQQADILSVSLVSIGKLSLSEGTSGIVEFVAINPEQYSHVGYGYSGEELDNSDQTSILGELETNPEGAILTSDIASEYSLTPGDVLRVFSFGDESITIEFNIISLTTAIPRPKVIGQASSDNVIGTRKIWLNRNYVGSIVDLNATTETYLCARTIENGNTTQIGEDALSEFETVLPSLNQWSSTTAELTSFRSRADYSIDRSLDSMITISMIFCILVAFTAFQVNKHLVRKREVALLKSLGATSNHVLRIKIAEVLALIIIGIIFTIIFSPLTIANILRIGILDYSLWAYIFPVSIIASANWISYLWVSMLLLIPSIVLVVVLSMRGDDENIAEIMAEIEIARESAYSGERI